MSKHTEALQDELDELEDRALEDDPNIGRLNADERERLAVLRAFVESAPDWSELIHEADFEDYARELAVETGTIALDTWPASCIDWEEAAEAIRSDYSAYEIDGMTFYSQA